MANFACIRAEKANPFTCIDILWFLVHIHGSIHTIHILIHSLYRLLMGFFMVFHRIRREYVSRTVEENYKNRACNTHSLCKYGITVSEGICSYASQNHIGTSIPNTIFFRKTSGFFIDILHFYSTTNALTGARIVALLRERRLIARSMEKEIRATFAARRIHENRFFKSPTANVRRIDPCLSRSKDTAPR